MAISPITLYGAPADLAGLTNVVDAEYPIDYVPVPDWSFEAGTAAFGAGVIDGKVVVGSLTASGNSFQGSYHDAGFYVFDPVTLDWSHVVLETDEGFTGVVGSDGFGRGDVTGFSVTGGKLIATVAVDYSNWVIGTYGRYPAWIEVDVDTPGVGPGSMTIPELRAAAAVDGAVSWPDAVNVHAETFATNVGMFASDTLPNGWLVIINYVSGVTGEHSGSVRCLDEDGIQRAYLKFPNMQTASGTLLFYAPKYVSADDSHTDPTDMRFLVSADVFIRSTVTQMPFSVQEMTVNAVTGTIDYVTAPVLFATHDETTTTSTYLGSYGGQYAKDGTVWIHSAQPTVGFGFAQRAMQAMWSTAGERRWTAEAPPAAGWENRYGEFRLVADYELGALDVASSLHSGQWEDSLGAQLVVGQGGQLFPFVPDASHALRPSILSNSLYASNVTGWSSFGVTGTVAHEATDGGRLKFTANGTSTSAFWVTDSGGVYSPLSVGSVGQSLWAWARVKSAVTPRRARVQVQFVNDLNVAVGPTVIGPYSFTNTTTYVKLTCPVKVPVGATKYKIFVQVNRETGGNIPNLELHYSDEAHVSIAPVTHLPQGDLNLSVLPIGTGDTRWPSGAGLMWQVDTNRRAWFPIRVPDSGGGQPLPIPQYLCCVNMKEIFEPTPAVSVPTLLIIDRTHRYTYLSADIVSGEIIAELPMRGVKLGKVLKGTGTFEGDVTLGDSNFTDLDLVDATDPNRRVIYVDRDGELIWGGILWGRKYSSQSGRLAISAVEFFSYFVRQYLLVDSSTLFDNEQVDQFDIMRALLNYVQSKPGGDLGFVLSDAGLLSGVLRDREWFDFEFKQVAEAMSQLSDVENGFDFGFDVRWSNNLPERYMWLAYPRSGRSAANNGLLFDKPGNINSLGYDEDGTTQSVDTWSTGSGDEDLKLRAHSLDTGLFGEGYPLFEQVTDYSDVVIPATLQGHANMDQSKNRHPFSTLSITVDANMEPPIEQVKLGDDARVKIAPGDLRFPEGMDESRRIVAWELSPESSEYGLTLEDIQIL